MVCTHCCNAKESHIRLCVDLSRLSHYVRRERFQSPTPSEAVADIAAEDTKFFTILDVQKGCHQCLLDEATQLLTTFIMSFGWFKYCRAPYRLSSIIEHYNRRMTEAFEGVSGFHRIMDNIVIYDKDAKTHMTHVRQFLQCYKEIKIALNRDTCKFGQTEVTFAGLRLMRTIVLTQQSQRRSLSFLVLPHSQTSALFRAS